MTATSEMSAHLQRDRRGGLQQLVMQVVSLRRDAGLLDDRPPFLDLGLVEGSESLRSLLFALRNLVTKAGQSLTDPRISQGSPDCSVELGNDVLRRPLWHKERQPSRDVEPRQSRLI